MGPWTHGARSVSFAGDVELAAISPEAREERDDLCTLIKGRKLIDGKGNAIEEAAVLMDGDRITAVGRQADVTPGRTVGRVAGREDPCCGINRRMGGGRGRVVGAGAGVQDVLPGVPGGRAGPGDIQEHEDGELVSANLTESRRR